MNRQIKFRAFWRDTLKPILDFNDEYIIDACNDDVFIVNQFTGLKDANGNEIYEGDILREPAKNDWEETNYSCFEVLFHDNDANSDYNIGWTMNRMHNHGAVCGGYIPAFKPNAVKRMCVIGNVYKNPELLGVS